MIRDIVRIGCNAPPEKAERLLRVLGRVGLEQRQSRTGYLFRFDKGDPRVPILIRELKKNGIFYDISYEREFSRHEIESAEFLHMIVRATCGEMYEHPGLFDSSSSCPRCGSVGRQIGNLRINKLKMGTKKIAETWTGHLVISDSLLVELNREDVRGWSVRPVEHYAAWSSEQPEPHLYQMLPDIILPPMAPTAVFNRSRSKLSCNLCGAGLTWRDDVQFAYGPSIRHITNDWSWTHEQFGFRYKMPAPIVSARTYRLLREAKVRNLDFRPVALLDG